MSLYSEDDKYEWIESVLRRFRYAGLRRAHKGLIRQYIRKVTGYSPAQVTRLIGRCNRSGELHRKEYHRHRFEGKYDPFRLISELEKTELY
ncbi:MAG: hypothetical protein SVM79_00250 [Chloroflexota bacterium]|nr:hypothetical protein [Chloroflexota bacterium]